MNYTDIFQIEENEIKLIIENINKINISNISEYFKSINNWYLKSKLSETNNLILKDIRYKVFFEFILNINKKIINDIQSVNYSSFLCINQIMIFSFKKSIKYNHDLNKAYELFRNNILKQTMDDGWVNKQLFSKNEAITIFNLFFDEFIFRLHFYKHIFGRKEELELSVKNNLEYVNNINIELKNIKIIDPKTIRELNHNSEEDEFISVDKIDIDGVLLKNILLDNAKLPILSKSEQRALLLKEENERLYKNILDKKICEIKIEYKNKIDQISQ